MSIEWMKWGNRFIEGDRMKISAHLQNQRDDHQVFVATDGNAHMLSISSKQSGYGSSVNGGEFLCLAIATCYCNDIYREASKRGIWVEQVDVEVESEFGNEGEPARKISYNARVKARTSEANIYELMTATDHLAEIQNTLRHGLSIRLNRMEAVELEHAEHMHQVSSEVNR
jgi:uncharacterized OsmC-like protein